MKRILTIACCILLSSGLIACSAADAELDVTATAPLVGDPNPDAKPVGETCVGSTDCRTGVCGGSTCQASTGNDGVKNGDETDVDCGGSKSPACAVGKACVKSADCATKSCKSYRCSDPAPQAGAGGTKVQSAPLPGAFDDGVKNGTETDVDCGGPAPGPRCAVGKTCTTHTDCASNGCAFDGTCSQRASCTQLEGGQTCGASDTLSKQNDCCESAPVSGHTIDKYLVTAGRMRAFLTRLDGKVRDWAAGLPANRWNQGHTASLPNSIDGTPGNGGNANTQLGPFYNKRSCETGYHTGHTYWTPSNYGDKKDFPQNVLDAKALNCVPWQLLAALCVFDGGHLATEAELRAAYTNDGKTAYPWGAIGSYTAAGQTPFAVQEFSYVTAGKAPKNADGFFDIAANIAPPGRRPSGYNATGHADLVGNLLEWVSDRQSQFIWKGSFERHAAEAADLNAPAKNDPFLARTDANTPWLWSDVGAKDGNPNGYYAIGGRCAY